MCVCISVVVKKGNNPKSINTVSELNHFCTQCIITPLHFLRECPLPEFSLSGVTRAVRQIHPIPHLPALPHSWTPQCAPVTALPWDTLPALQHSASTAYSNCLLAPLHPSSLLPTSSPSLCSCTPTVPGPRHHSSHRAGIVLSSLNSVQALFPGGGAKKSRSK